MKKSLAIILGLTLVLSMFTGCAKKDATTDAPAATTAPVATTAPEATVETTVEATVEATTDDTTAAVAKTGLAVITSIAKSADVATDAEGLGQVDSVVVAVLVGEDGIILDCAIDTAQTKMNFSAEGKLTTDLATVYKSKQELGTEYGVGAISTIGKEWNEQATALAEYVVGKTIDEVKGIAITEEGVPTDADLSASVTIKIAGYIEAMEKAVTNAQDIGAKATDKLGLGVSTDIAKSTDAAADAEGLAQAYSNYAAVTTSADGIITSCAIDASQSNVNFSTVGVVTSDLTAALKTKQELGLDYGMLAKSTIGKEWFEQANAFAVYAVGKTIDEVKGVAVSEEGTPSDADLASSVTIHVAPYIGVIEKAVANAAK